jgi:Protein of unknown function (DUF1640)
MNRYRRIVPVLQPILHQPLFQQKLLYQTAVFPWTNVLCTRHFASTPQRRSVNFDTLKVVQRLETEGFTPEQSKAVMELLKDVIDESVLGLTRTMVTRDEQDKVVYQQKVDFAQLRSELQTLDKNEFTSTKNEHDRLTVEIEKLRQKFREEVSKIQASVRLDLNLEKGRIRDESSVHELKIKETDNRIEYGPIWRC